MKLLSFLSYRILVVQNNILLLLFSVVVLAVAQRSFLPHCEPVNETVAVEKEGCPKCLVFQTTICSGHCLTKVLTFLSVSLFFTCSFAWKHFSSTLIWIHINIQASLFPVVTVYYLTFLGACIQEPIFHCLPTCVHLPGRALRDGPPARLSSRGRPPYHLPGGSQLRLQPVHHGHVRLYDWKPAAWLLHVSERGFPCLLAPFNHKTTILCLVHQTKSVQTDKLSL